MGGKTLGKERTECFEWPEGDQPIRITGITFTTEDEDEGPAFTPVVHVKGVSEDGRVDSEPICCAQCGGEDFETESVAFGVSQDSREFVRKCLACGTIVSPLHQSIATSQDNPESERRFRVGAERQESYQGDIEQIDDKR